MRCGDWASERACAAFSERAACEGDWEGAIEGVREGASDVMRPEGACVMASVRRSVEASKAWAGVRTPCSSASSSSIKHHLRPPQMRILRERCRGLPGLAFPHPWEGGALGREV